MTHRPAPFTTVARALLAAFVLSLAALPAADAQVLGGDTASEEPGPAPDPLGRGTPQGLVTGLVAALAAGEDARIARYFEALNGPDAPGRGVADLAVALDAGVDLRSASELSLAPEGRLDDGLDSNLERIGHLRGADAEIDVLARRVELGDRSVWLISHESATALAAWRPGASDLLDDARTWSARLPAGPDVLGVPARDWLLMAAFAAVSYALASLLFLLRKRLHGVIVRHTGTSRFSRFMVASEPPVRLFVAALIFSGGVSFLGLSIVARFHLVSVVQITGWFAGVWFAMRLIDALADVALERMSQRGAITAGSAVSLASRVGKVIVGLIFVATALRAFGVDLTAGLAALGIGGLAFAFGAQKLVENLIGSVTLIADRPVRVGDFCRFGQTLGTVEEIGIRSTKVRTLGRTIVTVPNGEFSSLHLENFTRRDIFHFHHTLGVRYETTPDQMRELLWRLRQMLLEHGSVDPDPARVRFVNFAAYSLDVEIFAYVHTADWNAYLEVQEALMLQAMDIVEACRTGFAFPSQTVYLNRDEAPASALREVA